MTNKLFFIVIIITACISIDLSAQVQIDYKNPPIYAREGSGQVPTFRGSFDDSGYLVFDAEEKSITMVSDTREQRIFSFFDINREPISGHYLGFGDNTMINFIPEDRLLILMFRRNNTYNFLLTESENSTLLQELK